MDRLFRPFLADPSSDRLAFLGPPFRAVVVRVVDGRAGSSVGCRVATSFDVDGWVGACLVLGHPSCVVASCCLGPSEVRSCAVDRSAAHRLACAVASCLAGVGPVAVRIGLGDRACRVGLEHKKLKVSVFLEMLEFRVCERSHRGMCQIDCIASNIELEEILLLPKD